MIRRAETVADFAICARIKNVVRPREPVTDEARALGLTQEGNDAMRSLNLKLGYRERLAAIAVRGPLQ